MYVYTKCTPPQGCYLLSAPQYRYLYVSLKYAKAFQYYITNATSICHMLFTLFLYSTWKESFICSKFHFDTSPLENKYPAVSVREDTSKMTLHLKGSEVCKSSQSFSDLIPEF